MKGESIVYFGKEWSENPTSCNHVFDQLSRYNQVLWVNSVATRTPELSSTADWKRIISKLRRFAGGLQQVGPSAWLYQPAVVPLPYSSLAQSLNRALLTIGLRRQMKKIGMNRPQFWSFLPNLDYLVGRLGESVSVYYCVDDWPQLKGQHDERIAALERKLVEKVDVRFATSHLLAEARRRYNPATVVAAHGVNHAHFAKALSADTPVPENVASLPHPVIGFFGGIHDRLDLDLLAAIARSHPQWSLVLIGKVATDLSRVRLPNVHVLGPRPYQSLPGYCKAFDVGLMPYVDSEWIRHSSPIKLREYLSAGLPAVSTDVPEVRRYSSLVYVAQDAPEFIRFIEQALREDSPGKHRARSEAMRGETWEAKMAQVCERVMQVKTARNS